MALKELNLSGNVFADLNPEDTSSTILARGFGTVPGQAYGFNFYVLSTDNSNPLQIAVSEAGNLIGDLDEDIDEGGIVWDVYGKIRSISRVNTSEEDDLIFEYDAAGNRVTKIAIPKEDAGGGTWQPRDDEYWHYTHYLRDAQGNILATYEEENINQTNPSEVTFQREFNIYGSTRLGIYRDVYDPPSLSFGEYWWESGHKAYELSNHLGNVLATISDLKVGTDNGSDDIVDKYTPHLVSIQDYYPFGMLMPGRSYASGDGGYRFGFNGKEMDSEVSGQGNQYDYGFRIYNPRLGKFLSVDPLTPDYPVLTPYQFASNTPIMAVDLDGLEAHVVIYDHYIGQDKPEMRIVFDKNLEKPGGVYTVHNYYSEDNSWITGITWGTANYSDYPEQFPNEGQYWRDDGKPLFTLEEHGRIVYGEVGFDFAELASFEFGVDGSIVGGDIAIGLFQKYFETNSRSVINGTDKPSAGGGIGLIANMEYRRDLESDLSYFKKSDQFSVGLAFPPVGIGGEVEVNTFGDGGNDDAQIKLGVPEFKLALGLGFSFGGYIGLNPQPKLTSFEKKEKKAMNNNAEIRSNNPIESINGGQ